MKSRVKAQDSGVEELFRSKLKNVINMRHELVRLGELIDWARLEDWKRILRRTTARRGTAGIADPAGGGAASAETYRGLVG